MRIPILTARHERQKCRKAADRRRIDAWADRLIDEYELHLLNEDITYPGDPPYYDSCPAMNDGHVHISPDWPFYAGYGAPDA